MKPLSERERRFVDAYMGPAYGNASEACRLAGYSIKAATVQGARMLAKASIQSAIAERVKADPTIATRDERQRLWSDIAFGRGVYSEAALKDRLRASELLGKSQADFVERHEHAGKDGGPVVVTFTVVQDAGRPAS